jgi:hypothetical protein
MNQGARNSATDRVFDFVAQFCKVPRTELRVETKLAQDLGLDGDDAAEFIDIFAKGFQVDMATFRFERHFFSEGEPFVRWLWFKLFSPAKLSKEPITLGDLASAVRDGRWGK